MIGFRKPRKVPQLLCRSARHAQVLQAIETLDEEVRVSESPASKRLRAGFYKMTSGFGTAGQLEAG